MNSFISFYIESRILMLNCDILKQIIELMYKENLGIVH